MKLQSFVVAAAVACGVSAQSLNDVLSSTSQVSSLAGLIKGYPDLVSSLSSASNITILAPDNDAVSALLASPTGKSLANDTDAIKAVLEYHVLQGVYQSTDIKSTPAFVPSLLNNATYDRVTGGQVVEAALTNNKVVFTSGLLQTSNVVQADVKFDGGVIHIIDSVLTVPANASTTAVTAGLTDLASALTSANLVSAVDSLSDVTIFAPSNSAFAAINSTVSSASTAALTNILTYHVVNGTVGYSTKLTDGQTLTALNGAKLTVHIEKDGSVFVNSAKVVTPNVLVANGVVHVIDNVLNPNSTSATPSPSATGGSPAYPTGSGSPSGTASNTASSPSSTVETTNAASGRLSSPASLGGSFVALLLSVFLM